MLQSIHFDTRVIVGIVSVNVDAPVALDHMIAGWFSLRINAVQYVSMRFCYTFITNGVQYVSKRFILVLL